MSEEGYKETPEEIKQTVRSQVQIELRKFDGLVGKNPDAPRGDGHFEVQDYIDRRYDHRRESALYWGKVAEEIPEDPVAILKYLVDKCSTTDFRLSGKTFEALLFEARMPSFEALSATMPKDLMYIANRGLVSLFYQIAHWAGGVDKVPEYIANGGKIKEEKDANDAFAERDLNNYRAQQTSERNKVKDTNKRVQETLKRMK